MFKAPTKKLCRPCREFVPIDLWKDHRRLHDDQLPITDLAPLTIVVEKKQRKNQRVAS